MSQDKEGRKKDEEKVEESLNQMMGEMSLSDDKEPHPLESPDIAGVAKYIKDGHAKNIIVMTGAGISCNAGIPDFRSPGTGLYYNLQQYHLRDPQDVFSIDYFNKNPNPFYCVAKAIYPGQFHPTKVHYFIKLLAQHGLLLQNFTQNIDTLELIAGIPQDKVIYSHGSFSQSHCVKCHKLYSYEYVRERIFAEEIITAQCNETVTVKCKCGASEEVQCVCGISEVIKCSKCGATKAVMCKCSCECEAGRAVAGKCAPGNCATCKCNPERILKCDKCGGSIKPDIVFFGEDLPAKFFQHRESDFPKCDLLIVMGTSLVVHPFADLISFVDDDVPRLLINNEVVRCKPAPRGEKRSFHYDSSDFAFNDPDNYRDALYKGDVDKGIEELAEALGWSEELQKMYDAPVDFGSVKFN